MDYASAIILAVIQGLSEFLPISSTGHLIIAREIFGLQSADALAYDAVLHLATALAVIFYFRMELWRLFNVFLRMVGRLPTDVRDSTLIYALSFGTVPAALLGLLLEDIIATLFRSPLLVAAALIIGSTLFAVAEYVEKSRSRSGPMTIWKGVGIGLFQTLALIPGMSRSGSAIAGGMLLGMSRYDSAQFAFLLAVPLMVGAGGKKLLELLSGEGELMLAPLLSGFFIAFVVALCAIHFMLRYVRTHTLWPFIWYRLVLAALILVSMFSL